MFGVELAAIVEASKEETTKAEDKKAEKTSLKEEANKEVHKDVEMKVDEREKPKVPVSLFEVSPGFVMPVPLNKQEQNLLLDSLKIPMDLSHKQAINNEDSKVQKPKVEEKKPGKPKVVVCPPKVPEKKPEASGIKIYSKGVEEDINSEERDTNTGVNGRGTTLPTNEQGNKLNNEKKNGSASCAESRLNGSVNKEIKSTNEQDDLDAKLAKKVAERNAQRSAANIKHDYPIDNWQAPSGTTGNGKSSAASDAQPPKGLTNDVKVEKCVEGQSVGKT